MSSKKSKVDLNNFFCEHPFVYSEFHRKYDNWPKVEETQFLCCPDWNDVNIRVSDNLMENWYSDAAVSVRKGHLSGDFKGCNANSCPALNTLMRTGKPAGNIKHKSEWDPKKYTNHGPHRVKICSDDSCNLKCPTCREELRPNTPEKTTRTGLLLKAITRDYGPTLKSVYTSGGGDPFYSTPMREFLQDIDKEKFPSLEEVVLHTNGILFTPKVWEKMKNIHPNATMVEISIDAATKDTYENKTRLGGKWDVLMENLKFISTIPTINMIMLDFVVQKANFREMEDFVLMGQRIFGESGKGLQINFQKVWPWPSLRPEVYKDMCVWDNDHADYKDFCTEIRKLDKYENILHNLNEHLEDQRPLI
jgi:sulfatase maturation enzyme AslB (radical SAM superfamily)